MTSINIGNNIPSLVRASINTVLQAIVSGFAGDVEPTETYEFMVWHDTTDLSNIVVKQRSKDNTSWSIMGHIKDDKLYLNGLNISEIQELEDFPADYDIVYRDRQTGECFIKI